MSTQPSEIIIIDVGQIVVDDQRFIDSDRVLNLKTHLAPIVYVYVSIYMYMIK